MRAIAVCGLAMGARSAWFASLSPAPVAGSKAVRALAGLEECESW